MSISMKDWSAVDNKSDVKSPVIDFGVGGSSAMDTSDSDWALGTGSSGSGGSDYTDMILDFEPVVRPVIRYELISGAMDFKAQLVVGSPIAGGSGGGGGGGGGSGGGVESAIHIALKSRNLFDAAQQHAVCHVRIPRDDSL